MEYGDEFNDEEEKDYKKERSLTEKAKPPSALKKTKRYESEEEDGS